MSNLWTTTELAEEITKILNREKWPLSLKARRRYYGVRTREDGEEITATVTPFEMTEQGLKDRRAVASELHTVSIAVQKGIRNKDDNNELDPLAKLVETIADYLRAEKTIQLSDGHVVAYVSAEIGMVREALTDLGMFFGFTNISYRVVR